MVGYEEDWCGAPVDPIGLVTRLARAAPYPDYAVYERDGRWTFAGGVPAAVSLEAGRSCRVIEDPETGTPLVVPIRRGTRDRSAAMSTSDGHV